MVAMASTVTVRGEGMARGRPDRYSIGLTVTRLEATPDAALEEVARRSAALEEAFTAVGLKSADWSSSGVSVRPESEWDAQRQEHRLRGHRATVHVMVTHDDPKLAARLVRQFSRRRRRWSDRAGRCPPAIQRGPKPAPRRPATLTAGPSPTPGPWA